LAALGIAVAAALTTFGVLAQKPDDHLSKSTTVQEIVK
jgi:hypothetical protein